MLLFLALLAGHQTGRQQIVEIFLGLGLFADDNWSSSRRRILLLLLLLLLGRNLGLQCRRVVGVALLGGTGLVE